jgi:thiamine-phosphate pyrophosphorylase
LSSIYALFDFELNEKNQKSIEEFIYLCTKYDAKVIQYRDKINSVQTQRANILKIKDLWSGIVIVNDSVDLAKFCDGVHLGQEDLSKLDSDYNRAIGKIRSIIGRKIIGVSTHNRDEVLQTNSLDIDYIGLGAYRDTDTKKDIKYILGSNIEKLAMLSSKDVAVIGGVKVSDKIDFATYRVVGSDLYRDS